jgi:molybdopterin converting factor small subunit
LARIDINFIGLWRLLLEVRSIAIDVTKMDDVKDYIESKYGPILEDKLSSRGITNKWAIWDNSNVLLNGKNINQLDDPVLKDGDRLDLISKVAGG